MSTLFEEDGNSVSAEKKRDIIESVSALPSNYVGSKRRLLSYIYDALENHKISFNSVFDAFS